MQSFSPKGATERPPCPKCGASMLLTRIVPKKLGINQRPYECVMCGYEETFSVPFKSAFAKQARLSYTMSPVVPKVSTSIQNPARQ
jgi:predicted RNA-binding Zn-ribbon protein involved in translation (DUF1610 family)